MAAETAGARRPRQRHARGFTLIEVLVSLLVFSFGVLGMVGLQARSMQFQGAASDRARATGLANELTALMWSQQRTTLDAATLAAWNARVADPTVRGLPNGTGTVSAADADGVVTITVAWRSATAASGGGSNYQTQVAIP